MLEELNQISWDVLGASSMPHWLRSLTSSDREKRNPAFKDLERYLVPWEAIELGAYSPEQMIELVRREVIVLAIPFLIHLLMDEEVQDKELLLLLLDELVGYKDGAIYLEQTFQEEYMGYVKRIYDAVLKGHGVYQTLAENASYNVRTGANELLESLKQSL